MLASLVLLLQTGSLVYIVNIPDLAISVSGTSNLQINVSVFRSNQDSDYGQRARDF